jgi:LEA14-like dessication related protein
MQSMKKKQGAIVLIVIVGALGVLGALEYYSIVNIGYNVQGISLDSYSVQLTSFDVNMRLFVDFTSPAMPVWVSGGTYDLKLNGIDIGGGAFGEIWATTSGSVTTVALNATLDNSYLVNYIAMAALYLAGNNITMDMTIKSVTVLGFITLSPNIVITQEINKNTSMQ